MARGLGMEGVSDLDTIAVTRKDPKELDLHWVKQTEQEINKKFVCVNGVELSFYSMKEILDTSTFSMISFMLKTHSVCVYGEDLTELLPKYKVDTTLANENLVHLKGQIEQAQMDCIGNDDIEDVKDCCSWIMKIMVRAGLALVIMDEGLYTRDLYPAYQLFSKHYPDKESQMKTALEYAIEPISNPDQLFIFLNDFGPWLIKEAEEWRKIHPVNKN